VVSLQVASRCLPTGQEPIVQDCSPQPVPATSAEERKNTAYAALPSAATTAPNVHTSVDTMYTFAKHPRLTEAHASAVAKTAPVAPQPAQVPAATTGAHSVLRNTDAMEVADLIATCTTIEQAMPSSSVRSHGENGKEAHHDYERTATVITKEPSGSNELLGSFENPSSAMLRCQLAPSGVECQAQAEPSMAMCPASPPSTPQSSVPETHAPEEATTLGFVGDLCIHIATERAGHCPAKQAADAEVCGCTQPSSANLQCHGTSKKCTAETPKETSTENESSGEHSLAHIEQDTVGTCGLSEGCAVRMHPGCGHGGCKAQRRERAHMLKAPPRTLETEEDTASPGSVVHQNGVSRTADMRSACGGRSSPACDVFKESLHGVGTRAVLSSASVRHSRSLEGGGSSPGNQGNHGAAAVVAVAVPLSPAGGSKGRRAVRTGSHMGRRAAIGKKRTFSSLLRRK
jgi:hypothetical protein